MFDDPNKNLKKLQEQLWAAEEPEEDIFAPPRTEEPEYDVDYNEDYGEYPEEETPEEEIQEEEIQEQKRKTRQTLLVALLLLEVALLFGVLAWWLLW